MADTCADQPHQSPSLQLDLDDRSAAMNEKSIYDLISGDVYEGLKSSFLTTGKGRRPDPPVVPMTNLLFLMLHTLRLEGNRTTREMTTWFSKLMPGIDFPEDRLRRRIDRVVSKSLTLLGTTALVSFVNEPLNLNSISPSLDQLGLDKKSVFSMESWTRPVESVLTNEAVIDLTMFRSKEKLSKSGFLHKWIIVILGLSLTDNLIDLCRKKVEKLFSKYKELSKQKGSKEDGRMEFFLSEQFCLSPQNENALPPEDTRSLRTCNCNTIKYDMSNLKKENASLVERVKSLSEENNVLSVKFNVVQDRLETANKMYIDLKSKFEEALSSIQKLTDKVMNVTLLKTKLKSLRLSLKRSQKNNLNLKRHGEENFKKLSQAGDKLKREQIKIKNLKREIKVLKSSVSGTSIKGNEFFNDGPIMLKGNTKNVYSDGMRKTVISLICEAGVAAANVSKVVSLVAKGIFNHEFFEPLPSKQTALNMCGEGHVLSNIQVVENVLNSSDVTLHCDGTSRDQTKIVGHQFTLSNGDKFYLGFTTVTCEDSGTLLDVTLSLLRKLSSCYAEASPETSESVFFNILSKITSIMTDRAATMKLFDQKFLDFLKTEVGSHVHVHFLHCNAHFLLDLSGACEKALTVTEKELIESAGERLGRDKEKQFAHFKDTECATNRLLRTTCDILGPRGDQKNGCRTDWTSFCSGSLIPSFKSNRFNCFFQAAAAIIYHHVTLKRFFTSGVLPENPNLKIKSVSLDICDNTLMTFVCAVALLYLKITGPYWTLVNSSIKYVEFHKYVKMLDSYLEKWSHNPSELLDISFRSVFGPDITFHSPTFTAVHDFIEMCDFPLLKKILVDISRGFSEVTNRQLSDFLLNGTYADEADPETTAALQHCPLTNLMGENAFGDLDYDMS